MRRRRRSVSGGSLCGLLPATTARSTRRRAWAEFHALADVGRAIVKVLKSIHGDVGFVAEQMDPLSRVGDGVGDGVEGGVGNGVGDGVRDEVGDGAGEMENNEEGMEGIIGVGGTEGTVGVGEMEDNEEGMEGTLE